MQRFIPTGYWFLRRAMVCSGFVVSFGVDNLHLSDSFNHDHCIGLLSIMGDIG